MRGRKEREGKKGIKLTLVGVNIDLGLVVKGREGVSGEAVLAS